MTRTPQSPRADRSRFGSGRFEAKTSSLCYDDSTARHKRAVTSANMSSAHSAAQPPRRINEERVCIDALKHVLLTRCGCTEVHVREEASDPPDYTITVDGTCYPAEVTSIVSLQAYYDHCKKFAQAIRDRAHSEGVLSGTYALEISRHPNIPKPTSHRGRQLLDRAVDYLRATREATTSAKLEIATDETGKIRIVKVSGEGAAVGALWTPPAMWEGEVQGELATLMQRAVTTKTKKLQKVGIEPQRAFLLLYDAHGLGDANDAAIALRQVKGYDWFHSIFWAASFTNRTNAVYPDEPGRKGIFLFSSAPNWNGVGSVSLETDG